MHFSQLMTKEEFQAYDEGAEMNQIKYNQQQPPVFDLSNIRSVPIAIFVGQ